MFKISFNTNIMHEFMAQFFFNLVKILTCGIKEIINSKYI
jgi:hypothetical protein